MPTDRDAIARKAQQRTEREAQIYADHWAAMKAGEREQCWSLQGRFRNTVSLSGDEREAWGAVVALEGHLVLKSIAYHAHELHMAPYDVCSVPTCVTDRTALAEARTRWESVKAKIEEAG